MKIAIASHLKYPIAQPFAGGLEMHTHFLAGGLMRRGHDVTLFAATGSDSCLSLSEVCDPTGESHGNSTVEITIDLVESAAYRRMMNGIARGDFDIVHNNSLHWRPPLTAGALDIPMVTVLHTPPFDPLAEALATAGSATDVIAVSADLARHWTQLRRSIEVIPNGIDLSLFRMAKRERTTPYAFWSGRIIPEKGLHFAIDAARAAGLPLVFAGPRPDLTYWETEIAPRMGADLTDLGHLAHAELARHLAAASVAIVSPSWDEPFGLVVVEALGCGTPVAAFGRGAIPSLLGPKCGALARPDDSLDLARAIHAALACDPEDCHAAARARFDGERMIDRYEALYARLIDRRMALEPAPTAMNAKDLDEAFV